MLFFQLKQPSSTHFLYSVFIKLLKLDVRNLFYSEFLITIKEVIPTGWLPEKKSVIRNNHVKFVSGATGSFYLK